MSAILLIYAVGVLGTAMSFCRDEERGFLYRAEAMALWPARLAVGLIIRGGMASGSEVEGAGPGEGHGDE